MKTLKRLFQVKQKHNIRMGNFLNTGKVINSVLKDAGVEHVFPLVAEESTSLPFLTYRRTGCSILSTKDPYSEDTVYMEISVIGSTYAESVKTADTVYKALDRKKFSGFDIDIQDIHVTGGDESYQDNMYIQRLNLEIKIQ